jgi:hypothetical protein
MESRGSRCLVECPICDSLLGDDERAYCVPAGWIFSKYALPGFVSTFCVDCVGIDWRWSPKTGGECFVVCFQLVPVVYVGRFCGRVNH